MKAPSPRCTGTGSETGTARSAIALGILVFGIEEFGFVVSGISNFDGVVSSIVWFLVSQFLVLKVWYSGTPETANVSDGILTCIKCTMCWYCVGGLCVYDEWLWSRSGQTAATTTAPRPFYVMYNIVAPFYIV